MYKFKRFLAAVTASAVLVFSMLPMASAQQTPSGSGLSISPTLSQFTLKPGQADKLDITLKNITQNKINAQAYINDFTSDGRTGNPQIITNTNQASPNSIRKFVVGLDNVPLDVGQQKVETLALQIPAGTPPGAYYGIIRYKAVPAGTNAPAPGQVALSASVGTIVLITVPGNIKQQVELTNVLVYSGEGPDQHSGTIFFDKPSQAGVEIRNLGNGFAVPFGTVQVQSTFGKTVYTYQLNNTTPRGNVLPSSNRIFTNALKNITRPGRYTVTANVAYGSGSSVLVMKKTFWYIPTWLLIVILIVLLVLIGIALKAYRRYRKDVKRSYRRDRE